MRRREVFRASALRASFTVEAAFIVPLIVILIVLLIDMALYLRDLSVAEVLAARVAEDTRALILNDEEPHLHKVMYERKLEQSIFKRWFSDTAKDDADSMDDYLEEQGLVKVDEATGEMEYLDGDVDETEQLNYVLEVLRADGRKVSSVQVQLIQDAELQFGIEKGYYSEE